MNPAIILTEAKESKATITTTLYDLVAALNVEVGQDEEPLITAAVMHLVDAGRLHFLGEHKHHQPVWS